MRNIRLVIEYDGTNYAGWQCQKAGVKTIQDALERALFAILRRRARVVSSGRTDSGVHALAQTVNFKAASAIKLDKLCQGLNALLPEDIAVVRAEEAAEDFHSRFCARAKSYRYLILNRPCRSALLRNKAYHLSYPLDLKRMRQGAKALLGRHDFRSFQAAGSACKDTIRTIKKIKLGRDKELIYIDIEADGFLYNMARNIAGTLIEIGRGKFAPGAMSRILAARDRRTAGPTAPARGLCLMGVKYE